MAPGRPRPRHRRATVTWALTSDPPGPRGLLAPPSGALGLEEFPRPLCRPWTKLLPNSSCLQGYHPSLGIFCCFFSVVLFAVVLSVSSRRCLSNSGCVFRCARTFLPQPVPCKWDSCCVMVTITSCPLKSDDPRLWLGPLHFEEGGAPPCSRRGSAVAEGLAGVPVPVLEALPVLWLLLGALHSCCVDKRLQVQTAMGSGSGSLAPAPSLGSLLLCWVQPLGNLALRGPEAAEFPCGLGASPAGSPAAQAGLPMVAGPGCADGRGWARSPPLPHGKPGLCLGEGTGRWAGGSGRQSLLSPGWSEIRLKEPPPGPGTDWRQECSFPYRADGLLQKNLNYGRFLGLCYLLLKWFSCTYCLHAFKMLLSVMVYPRRLVELPGLCSGVSLSFQIWQFASAVPRRPVPPSASGTARIGSPSVQPNSLAFAMASADLPRPFWSLTDGRATHREASPGQPMLTVFGAGWPLSALCGYQWLSHVHQKL